MSNTYDPKKFGGKKEEEHVERFNLQLEDARSFFKNYTRPILDRNYKLYMSYTGDRAKEIKSWQSNIFISYIQAVVETLIPRVLDARPEYSIQGREEGDQIRAEKLQYLADYAWEVMGMDSVSEDLVRSSLVYGTGFMQVGWRKDVRKLKFLKGQDISSKEYDWVEEERVFYDAPFCEWVDNYSLWYDWHNVPKSSKRYWFRRILLTEDDIKRRYPMSEKKRLEAAFDSGNCDLEDYSSVRMSIKLTHNKILKNSDRSGSQSGISFEDRASDDLPGLKFHEVFEWWQPFEDRYSVMVNGVPILKGGFIPIPYNFKEAPFIAVPYLKVPGEFEGIGIPYLLENAQMMLNTIKNQRLDATTLNIHKMWIVNPLAGINRDELVTRPFGIIYSHDTGGVREVQFSDVKASAFREEELLKSDLRYSSGVDDFSMGAGGSAGSATEVRHLRESTLERVRLYVNHLGEGYSDHLRYIISLYDQFFTEKMTVRIAGDDGREIFPIIEKEDFKGLYDFKASVIPSIAGKNDIDKKQGMDLYQLLISLPFVDPKKLTSRVLRYFNWSLDSIAKGEEEQQMPPGMEGPPGAEGQEGALPPEMAGMAGQGAVEEGGGMLPMTNSGGDIPADVIRAAVGMLGGKEGGGSPFSELSRPVNLLRSGTLPPTAKGIPQGRNPRGHNRTGKVNTNISTNTRNTDADNIASQAANIQK